MSEPSSSASPFRTSGALLDIALWVEPSLLAQESAFARHLIMGLKSEGQTVSLIAPDDADLSLLPVLGSRVLHYRRHLWDRWLMLPLRLRKTVEELRAQPPDVLVMWGSADPLWAQALLDAIPLPTVVWAWDASELFTPLMRHPAVRQVIASSEPMLSRKPIDFVPELTLIRPGVFGSDEPAACFDVDGQMPCLVSLDPLADRPSYEALLRACRLLADEGLEFLLFAYDTGREEHPIWQFAEKLDLLDKISFVPFQHEAEPLLLHGDVYLHALPTRRVLNRTLEAMAKGLAVVSLPNPGADYLLDGHTCRIVPHATPEAWRDVLRDLLADRPATARLARNGQQHVRDHYALTRTIEQFLGVCRQVAGTPIPLPTR